jgi:hypothetical protein
MPRQSLERLQQARELGSLYETWKSIPSPEMIHQVCPACCAVESTAHRACAAQLMTIAIEGGYNYGTSWTDHFYQCPNGHPYVIGERTIALRALGGVQSRDTRLSLSRRLWRCHGCVHLL